MHVQCKGCRREYGREEFLTAAGQKKYTKCRACRRDEGRKRMKKRRKADPAAVREALLTLLGGKCVRCGYDDALAVLELELGIGTSGLELSRVIGNYAYGPTQERWQGILRIVSQAVILCPNCRKELRLGVWSGLSEMRKKPAAFINAPMPELL